MHPVTSILVRPHGVVTGRSALRISMTVATGRGAAGGGGWMILRRDGVLNIEVRIVLATGR
jgi:hypothetical protein